MNKYGRQLIVIPEDDADRQLALGFVRHDSVADRSVHLAPPAGGWPSVLATLKEVYAARLERNFEARVVLLIDFDEKKGRRGHIEKKIPEAIKDRVFIIGSWGEPEDVRRGTGLSFEDIGYTLAAECVGQHYELWESPYFSHNVEERARLSAAVRPFLFKR